MKFKKFDEIEAQPYPSDKAKNATGRVAIGKADGAENYCMRIMEVHKDGNTSSQPLRSPQAQEPGQCTLPI